MAEELQATELPTAEPSGEDPSAALIALGRENGHVTGEQIAAAVEEVELAPRSRSATCTAQLVEPASMIVADGATGDEEASPSRGRPPSRRTPSST